MTTRKSDTQKPLSVVKFKKRKTSPLAWSTDDDDDSLHPIYPWTCRNEMHDTTFVHTNVSPKSQYETIALYQDAAITEHRLPTQRQNDYYIIRIYGNKDLVETNNLRYVMVHAQNAITKPCSAHKKIHPIDLTVNDMQLKLIKCSHNNIQELVHEASLHHCGVPHLPN